MDRVNPATTLGRNGVSDWLIQRVSAVVIAFYFFFMLGFFLTHPNLQYSDWVTLFSNPVMKGFTLVALLMTLAHAWIGMWGVLTDYVTVRLLGPKATWLRVVFQLLILVVLIVLAIVGINILWGV